MKLEASSAVYFPHGIQISSTQWRSHDLGALSRTISERHIPPIVFFRQLALKLNRSNPAGSLPVSAGQLNLFVTLQNMYRYLIDVAAEEQSPGILIDAVRRSGYDPAGSVVAQVMTGFVDYFPPQPVLDGVSTSREWLLSPDGQAQHSKTVMREMLLSRLAALNRAVDSFRAILDDAPLVAACSGYTELVSGINQALSQGPCLKDFELTLPELLLAPITAFPDSLSGQVGFVRENWAALLPPELYQEVVTAFDMLAEEEYQRGGDGEPGPAPVLQFGAAARGGGHSSLGGGEYVDHAGYDYPEYERFSVDADWMSNVVMMAKMVYVWLDQLSAQHGIPITRLDQVPDSELDRLAEAGFSALWLIGVWERSPASQRIKQICGNPEAIASAYSLYDYEIAADLGGWEALANLRQRALQRGIRLASDMVPNHTGIYSRWVIQHPDWFVQTDYPPFPTYQFNGENLSASDDVQIQIEDGYWTKSDAAVVFRYVERSSGRTRYIYHGNDGTTIPWNDTAQLNYLLPEVREAVIQTILHVARNFPIIRFDAAMTLAKKHYQRLWFPIRGLGGGIPSRAEHGMSREEFDAVFPHEFWREVVDRVASEAHGTLLLAEAFWLMEGYFVRTLGMHRVYNSAFMNMLKKEENAKYRQTVKNVLEFNPEILKRFVNFMNNPDEKTAVEQFGTQGKYFGACVLLVTMPGLPMFGHGQIEGFHEKYGMEYKRAYWNEDVDQGLVNGHRLWIFPLLRRRWLFSGSENFVFYDFSNPHGVDENVFAYSNQVGGQRAIVLYHNAYSVTSGWIRLSTSIAVNSASEQPELYRKTLSEALQLRGDTGVYYAMREVASGHEFLRSGVDLVEKGLYAELGQYEFQVFIDLREIRDDGEGNWSRLCHALNGRGVECLEDESLLLRYATLNAAFAELLAYARPVAASVLSDDQVEFADLVEQFYAEISDQGLMSAEHCLTATAWVCKQFAGFSWLLLPESTESVTSATPVQSESVRDVTVLLAWLLLGGIPAQTLDQFGLAVTLQRNVGAVAVESLALLRALLAIDADRLAKDSLSMADLFEMEPVRSYLQVHESGGRIWFNKECHQELCRWFLMLRLNLAAKTGKGRGISLERAGLELQMQIDLASHAGYRVDLYLALIRPRPASGGRKRSSK